MREKPQVINTYEEDGVTVRVYEPEEEWPTLRKQFYICHDPGDSQSGSRPIPDSDSDYSKTISVGEGEASRCSIARELGGINVNDSNYRLRGK